MFNPRSLHRRRAVMALILNTNPGKPYKIVMDCKGNTIAEKLFSLYQKQVKDRTEYLNLTGTFTDMPLDMHYYIKALNGVLILSQHLDDPLRKQEHFRFKDQSVLAISPQAAKVMRGT